jgi:hypothetical protein
MSNILNSIERIAYSDNFKVWIDRFNDIVDELKDTNFAIDGEYVDLQSPQTIFGSKTFNNTIIFNSDVTISGNLNQANGLIQANTSTKTLDFKYGIDGNINFIGSNGINFLLTPTSNEFSLRFESIDSPNTLILDYALSDGTFKIANNVNLEIENSQIKFGDSIWNFPALIGGTSYLTSDGSDLSWIGDQDLAASIASVVGNTLALTNTAEILPVGTIIDIDTTKAEQWTGGLAGGNIPDNSFYGWLILNGGTITAANANSPFAELVNLLNPSGSFPKSAQLLPNSTSGSPSTVKLIKYLPDAVATFGLTKGNGISFFEADGITPKPGGTSTLKNGVTRIELNADSNVFQFNSGQLQLKTNVPRYTDNRLTTATPVNNTDATNKAYVDQLVAAGGVEGSCYDLMQSSDGLGYSDSKNSFSIVDKSGTGRVWRTAATSTLASDSIDADVTLNAISPFGSNFGKVTPLKSTFATPDQFFFTDHDDVIYGYGTNARGDIASTTRGLNEFSSYYNSGYFPTNPYSSSTQIRNLLPAFLPIQALWPANVVLADTITDISGSTDNYTNITIKTKDGYDNDYIDNNNPLFGLINYFNGSEAYTRGYYISTGRNINGQLGRGNSVDATASVGPLVWGPRIDSPGRNLWYNFALTEAQKTAIKPSGGLSSLLNNSTTAEQIRKRFNWFKPNAITAGGLRPDAPSALDEWRTQTSLLSESFDDYSWYIKKVVRTYDAHYVIVGKPGNEADNEVWCAGINRKGAFGNPATGLTTNIIDFIPMLSDVTSPNGPNTFKVLGTATSGTIFERSGGAPHGLSDFDILTYGTTNRYVILGDASGANRSTQFRLFSSLPGARQAFVGESQTLDDVTLTNSTTTGVAAPNVHRTRLKGIIDMSVSRGTGSDTSGDGIILRQAVTFVSPLTISLDRLPESDILTDRLIACGLNTNGRLAINSTTNPVSPIETTFTSPGRGNNKIVKIQTCNLSSVSFALSNNGLLYFAGNRASGCSNSGSAAAGNIVTWTNVNIQNVHDFFIIDDAFLTRIFVISQPIPGVFELYAGGINAGYILGTSVSLGAATPRFAKLIFPENPKNIVNIASAMNQTYVLCKDEGEDIGRVYVTGTEIGRSYFPVAGLTKIFPQFKKIDRDIL